MTEKNESFNVTAEHPIWLQGKGWTQAKDIKRADPIATQTGDILVLQNTRINQPLKVYNFSVANTPNYFVGTQGIWVHNAGNECDIYGGAGGNNAVITGIGAKFGSEAKLNRHFADHGNDFGARNVAEYQRQADGFLTSTRSQGVLEKTRANGDIVRFNPETDEFGVLSKDGVIRTYYKLELALHRWPTNLDYFNDQ